MSLTFKKRKSKRDEMSNVEESICKKYKGLFLWNILQNDTQNLISTRQTQKKKKKNEN